MNTKALHTSDSPILNAPLKQVLVRSTIPVIWGTLLLLGLVSLTRFVSLLGDRLAAISFTFPVTFTVISLNIGIGIGAAATVARLVGAGEHQQKGVRYISNYIRVSHHCFCCWYYRRFQTTYIYIFGRRRRSLATCRRLHSTMAFSGVCCRYQWCAIVCLERMAILSRQVKSWH